VNRLLTEAYEFGQNCVQWEKEALEAVLLVARALIDSAYLKRPAEELPEARRSHYMNASLQLQGAACLLLACAGATGHLETEPDEEEEAGLAGLDVAKLMEDRPRRRRPPSVN
jgi:hypothetical protein